LLEGDQIAYACPESHIAPTLSFTSGESTLPYSRTDVDETPMTNAAPQHSTTGRLIHWAAGYDLVAWAFLLGRERAFRERLIDLARLQSGERVLDVGCGTGTLAIAAKRRVGPTGSVVGIDASPEMVARASKKATKAGVDVAFKNAIVESLPFPDASFDAVLSTMMLHHLPRKAREQCAREMRRMLKPGGRALAVDFGPPQRRNLLAHFHRHGHVELRDLVGLLSGTGMNVLESGAVGMRNLQFVLAANGAPS
jgi:ubiquinone/menaquinone biosynthesis C-methylase UbiE